MPIAKLNLKKTITVFASLLIASAGNLATGQESTAAQQTQTEKQTKPTPRPTQASGTWRWDYDWNGQSMKDFVKFEMDTDGNLTGMIYSMNGTNQTKIQKGKVSGDQLSFDVPLEFEGLSMNLTFAGKIKEDSIDGTVSAESPDGNAMEFPWQPTRSVLIDDVVGSWRLEIENPEGGTISADLTLSKDGDKLVGKYVAEGGVTAEIFDLQIVKNKLSFSIQTIAQGMQIDADFTGRPYGRSIRGNVEYEVEEIFGTTPFTGKLMD